MKQATCGQGLAEHSLLPAKLGELIASVAQNLEVHMQTLDLQDENANKEHAVYQKLVTEHRYLAARLQEAGEFMAAQADLPMAKHDPKAMSSPTVVVAFEKLVRVEQELLELLQKRVDQDHAMLVEMPR
jgi:hypothetical protein